MTKQEEIREGIIVNIAMACLEMPNADIVKLTDKILRDEHSQGVVIKAERELPGWLMEGQEAFGKEDIVDRFKKAGFVATEPLIKE